MARRPGWPLAATAVAVLAAATAAVVLLLTHGYDPEVTVIHTGEGNHATDDSWESMGPAEAAERRELENATGAVLAEIRRVAGASYAGGWIDHTQSEAVQVRLVDDGLLAEVRTAAERSGLPVHVEVRPGPSVRELAVGANAIARDHGRDPGVDGTGVDERRGAVLVSVNPDFDLERVHELARSAQVAVVVEVSESWAGDDGS